MGRHEVKHTPKELRLHQEAVDRLIDIAVKRRECERELREYAAERGQEFVFGKKVPRRG